MNGSFKHTELKLSKSPKQRLFSLPRDFLVLCPMQESATPNPINAIRDPLAGKTEQAFCTATLTLIIVET